MMFNKSVLEFQWDKGNSGKNWIKHNVNDSECEEVFFDDKKLITKDAFHSGAEERFILLGETRGKRLLFVIFTVRQKIKIRIISARDCNKKERKLYEEKT